jgi:hypothetical protein
MRTGGVVVEGAAGAGLQAANATTITNAIINPTCFTFI